MAREWPFKADGFVGSGALCSQPSFMRIQSSYSGAGVDAGLLKVLEKKPQVGVRIVGKGSPELRLEKGLWWRRRGR